MKYHKVAGYVYEIENNCHILHGYTQIQPLLALLPFFHGNTQTHPLMRLQVPSSNQDSYPTTLSSHS